MKYSKLKTLLLCSVIVISSASSSFATESKVKSTAITIYSKAQPGAINPELYRSSGNYVHYNQIPGYAIVRQEREVLLGGKRSIVNLSDVAAFIDPTTVSFKSKTDPKGTTVLEQNYMFDLVSMAKLAERYLGKEISIEKPVGGNQPNEIISGKLISAKNNQLVIQKNDGSIISGYINQAIFPKLPGELFTKPTLVWDIATNKTGKHLTEVSYQTDGITWWADYNAIYSDGDNANNGFLDLGAWVSIVNKTGASYQNAKLKLIAGDVNRVQQNGGRVYRLEKSQEMMDMVTPSAIGGFAQKAFFEFHLYTLGRSTTLADNSTKQIELFPKAVKIPVEKLMVYYGSQGFRWHGGGGYSSGRNYGNNSSKKVDVYLKFKNAEASGLGVPLPAGRLRVSKLDDADGSQEFIGEDKIDHTPKNEEILIKLGSAFDIVGERTQKDFKIDNARKYMDETFEIKIRNHKDEAVNVIVKENLYRATNWKIYNSNTTYEKVDSNTVHFPIRVEKDGEHIIRYMVRYNWR